MIPEVFNKNKSYETFTGWIQFNRTDFRDIVQTFDKSFIDNWISVKIGDKFYEFTYISKTPVKFNTVKILRHVLAPYVQNSEPRGWFKGLDGEPLRYTSISNIFYMKGENDLDSFYALLEALETGKVNTKYLKCYSDYIGYGPKKLKNVE